MQRCEIRCAAKNRTALQHASEQALLQGYLLQDERVNVSEHASGIVHMTRRVPKADSQGEEEAFDNVKQARPPRFGSKAIAGSNQEGTEATGMRTVE